LYKVANNEKKRLESERKSWVKPLNDQVKRVNDAFRPMVSKLDEAMGIIKSKLNTWDREEAARLEKIRLKAEAEAEEKLKRDAAFAEEVEGDFEKADTLREMGPEPLADVPEGSRTYGRVSTGFTVKKKNYRVLDFAQVPDQYKMIDERLVREAIKEPGANIPGIEIFDEIETRIR